MKKYLIAALFTLCIYSFGHAQTPSVISIKGVVIDSLKSEPLGYVTVALVMPQTNKPVKSTLTKDDGSFILSGVPAENYKLVLAFVGYRNTTIAIDKPEKTIDLGKLLLAPATSLLKEVSVTAVKPVIKQEVDRISYDVQADPESKVQTVLDMMRKVPLLSLDADDNIKMNGNTNYKILINGKPSSLVARSPRDVFRAMPASSILKIEVITTPPAKYDSEGLAGIINIITNKSVDNGYNGSINLNEQFPAGGFGAGGSLTLKQGKFGASTYFGSGGYSQPQTDNSSTRITTGDSPSTLIQNGNRKSNGRYNYLGSELSYEIDTLNLITAEININTGNDKSSGFQSSVQTDIRNAITQAYDLSNSSKGGYDGYDLGLNYQLGFKRNKSQLLTLSYKYSSSSSDQLNNQDLANQVAYPNNDYRQYNDERSAEHTIQADYLHPFKTLNIEGGVKAILRNNDSDFRNDLLQPGTTDQFVTDPKQSNSYRNGQNIIGAYNSYSYNAGTWSFKAGARLEQTIIDADFYSNASQVDRNYLNLIPSLSASKRFKDMSSVNVGYTQRIQRPGIWQLNPFVDISNPNFVSSGNPDLNPVVNNNFKIGYSKFKKGSFNIGLNYNFANNTIQRISIYDELTKVTSSTYANIGKNRAYNSNFNINYPFTKNLNFTISGTLGYVWMQGIVNNRQEQNDGIQGYFYSSAGYKFDKGWRLNANMSYNSPYINLQGQSNAYVYSSVSASKEIIKDKLTASFSSNNPFTKYRNYISETTGTNFTQTQLSQSYFRTFRFSINYRFGKLQSEIKKNQRSIDNDDKSGGKSS